jgi:hypothetical protein
MFKKTKYHKGPHCYVCGDTDSNHFTKDKSRSNGYASTCKSCCKVRTRGRMEHRKPFIEAWKALGCQLCNEDCLAVIDAHHVEEKKYHVSGYSSRIGWQEWYKEVAKCVRLCANCHRKVHAKLLTIDHLARWTEDNVREEFNQFLKEREAP